MSAQVPTKGKGKKQDGGGLGQGQGQERQGAGPSYFYEDEVFRLNKHGDAEFGLVTENWDMYSDSSDDEEEQQDDMKVPHGSVAVTWFPKTKDEVILEEKVRLSDRSLMPGDVVRKLISGKDTQRGYCRTVRVLADVQPLGSKRVIMGVPATSLVPLEKLREDITVYFNSWVGTIKEVKYKVTLKFSDDTMAVVDGMTLLDNFMEIRNNSVEYSPSYFYPGQQLRGRMKHLKDADFSKISEELKRAKDRKTVNVIVSAVEAASVQVQWQWQTPDEHVGQENTDGFKPPPEFLTGEDVKNLKCLNLFEFESCTVQISDMSFYQEKEKDLVVEKGEWKKKVTQGMTMATKPVKEKPVNGDGGENTTEVEEEEENAQVNVNTTNSTTNANLNKTGKKSLPKVCTRNLRKKKLRKASRKPQLPKIEPEALAVVETLHTQSYVDIVWQDGTFEENVRSIDLYPIHHLDDHEFFPGDFVVPAEPSDLISYGVIQSMDHCGRVALVKWFESYSNETSQPRLIEEKEMSVYDIKDHPDFRFRPGTIVIRIANRVENQCPAGQIMDNYPDGKVRVWWADGLISSCWPQDIFRLREYDSDDGEMWDDHEDEGELEHEHEVKCTVIHSETENDEDATSTHSDSSWETDTDHEDETEEKGSGKEKGNNIDRYQKIGSLIDRIQSSLVSTREAIVATSNVTSNEEKPKMGTFDERGLTKKLLLIYKDCQYLDKIMGTKFFDIADFSKLQLPSSKEAHQSMSRRIMGQISKLFDGPLKPKPADKDATATASSNGNGPENPGTVMHDLCSIILAKLMEAHKEYEERFGKGKATNLDSLAAAIGMHTLDVSVMDDDDILVALVPKPSPSGVDSAVSQNPKEPGSSEDKSEPVVLVVEVQASTSKSSSNFSMIEKVPDTHRYRLTSFLPQNQRVFVKAVQKETSLLRESLPSGIYVKGFEDRMDLYSVLIEGPENTPYEDGIFMFDLQLPPNYPSAPPLVHYISFCTDRLNPNLYEEGKVCVSLLGTWNGKGTEVWTSSSTLLQLLISIQGLILNSEPYYNEAGYEKQKGTQQGAENSRMYNENVMIKLVQSMCRITTNPPAAWKEESLAYIKEHGPRMVERYRKWLALPGSEPDCPAFPLLPVSRGFHITLTKSLSSFAQLLSPLQPSS